MRRWRSAPSRVPASDSPGVRAASAGVLGVATIVPMAWCTGHRWNDARELVIAWTATDFLGAVSAGALLYAFVGSDPPALARAVRGRAVAGAAALAYAVYLLHEPLLRAIIRLRGGPAGTATEAAIVGLLLLAVLLPSAALAHRYVERPFLRLKDRQREPVATLP